LYFSAHWCPPCRTFTPLLKKFYEELKKENAPFEISLLTKGNTQNKENRVPNWRHTSEFRLQSSLLQFLSDKFGVCGIPTLVVVKPNGDLVTDSGEEDVATRSSSVQLL
ncbi:hypothetical protein PENTCL1PPCAC_13455, partial [Pristionchus entomophagus]